MKKLIALLLSIVLCMSLGSALADETVTLQMVMWDTTQEPGISEGLDAFVEANPDLDIEVSVVPWGEYWTKLQLGLASGTAPDLFWVNCVNLPSYINNGFLLDISDLVENEVDKADFAASLLGICQNAEGTYFAIPKDYDMTVVYYNKALFDAAGEAYPTSDWTWDDYVEKARALTVRDENGDITQYGAEVQVYSQGWAYSMVMANGGSVFNEDSTVCTINSPGSVEAYQMMVDLIHMEQVAPTIAELMEISADDRFMNGTLAMMRMSNCKAPDYYDMLGDDLAMVQVPKVESCVACIVPLVWAGAASTKYPEEVKQVLNWLGSAEGQSYNADVSMVANLEAQPLYLANLPEGLDSSMFELFATNNWAIPMPVAAAASSEVYTYFDTAFSEILSQPEVGTAVEELENTVNELIQSAE